MLQPHLKSRVGRRLFARFLLAALLPISGLAWFGYQNVEQMLIKTAHDQLTREGKAYGMSLIAALNLQASALHRALRQAEPSLPDAVPGFARLIEVERSTRVEAPGVRATLQWLPEGHPALRVARDGQSPVALLGELAGGAFWENDSTPERFCVFGTDRQRLHCSKDLGMLDGSIIPAVTSGQNAVVSEQRLGDTDFLLGFWHARYLPTLDSPGFTVMVAMPKDAALEALQQFRVAYPAVVLIAIALAAGFSIGQIRLQMAPLERLQQSTQRLAAGDLEARTGIAGDDEFGQLGQAFDGMAEHLQGKFQLLALLSELDRAILGSAERVQLAEILLRGLPAAAPCDGAGVVLYDGSGGGMLIASDLAASGGCSRMNVVAADGLGVGASRGWFALDAHDLPADWLTALSSRPLVRVLGFPAYLDGQLDSLLLLAFSTAPSSLEESIQSGRSLADRLAIAAGSLARDHMLYQQAHFDQLTGLPNRLLLRDRTEQAIAQARRTEASVALLFIDLDGFKQVNDSLGHAKGDTLLVDCARRLRERMRQGDTVARLGGDEFVVLIPDMARDTAYATADRVARDLCQLLAAPFQLESQQVVSPASIGIALYPDNATSHEDLLKMADEAMYESKRRGAGSYCFYTSNISALTRDRFELTQELRDAIARDELLLFYQPKVDARSGQLAGAEALLRWQSPRRGMVPPGLFVNLLDEMGLSTWLGEWVLDKACAQMQAWDAQGFVGFPVSVNFSPLQFERTPVIERVQAALSRYGLQAERLEVEILESMAANESPDVRMNLIRLRELGVRIALDDFGTGFSSLVHLTQVPADVVKLDRVFIHSLCTERRQRELVELIIAMAKVMELKVVAEGVEEAQQRAMLREIGCDLLQGYLIGHPVSPEAFAERWLMSVGEA